MAAATSQEIEAEEATRIDQIHFGLDKIEAYYVSFKEKRSITIKAQFDINSLKDYFPNIYEQFQIRDWEPFTMPLDAYFPELVREFYASYWAHQDLLKHRERVEMISCLSSMLVGS
ncbi:hypothetical protein HAX54_022199 [Datura stramonium]|uniref:Uncharacterized protein n=1 Tax=Datura stramonium TaxID=4076 RepID=A0ABS8UU48_DATST|nr:hypothetical protein [Datura stramonium]